MKEGMAVKVELVFIRPKKDNPVSLCDIHEYIVRRYPEISCCQRICGYSDPQLTLIMEEPT